MEENYALGGSVSFIKDAIANVMREVWLCSFIAVVILFVFRSISIMYTYDVKFKIKFFSNIKIEKI